MEAEDQPTTLDLSTVPGDLYQLVSGGEEPPMMGSTHLQLVSGGEEPPMMGGAPPSTHLLLPLGPPPPIAQQVGPSAAEEFFLLSFLRHNVVFYNFARKAFCKISCAKFLENKISTSIFSKKWRIAR